MHQAKRRVSRTEQGQQHTTAALRDCLVAVQQAPISTSRSSTVQTGTFTNTHVYQRLVSTYLMSAKPLLESPEIISVAGAYSMRFYFCRCSKHRTHAAYRALAYTTYEVWRQADEFYNNLRREHLPKNKHRIKLVGAFTKRSRRALLSGACGVDNDHDR